MANKGNGFLKGMLLGGAIATVGSLLYAPKSGKRLRKDIRKNSVKFKNDAETRLKRTRKMANRLLDDTQKRVDTLRREAESAVNDVVDKTSEFFEDGKHTIAREKKRWQDSWDRVYH